MGSVRAAKNNRGGDTVASDDSPGGPSSLEFELLVSGEATLTTIRLAGGRTYVVGRDPECDVVVDDTSVSRRHAQLLVGDGVAIIDFGSRNGTSVAGKRCVRGASALVPIGSVVQIGRATLLVQRARGVIETVARRAPARTAHLARRLAPPDTIVHDAAMLNLYALLDIVAPAPISVLVLGETGVGKELFAAAVHARSTRATQPFLALNCAALPDSILEAELFGYEKGAFTGAVRAKPGLFESAHGGTVFLDEVGDMPLATQAKLLRVLECGEVLRLGALTPKRVDVRFVAATNRDLEAAVADGRFRADVFFRLNGMTFTLPPLRERRADIVPLARAFVSRAAAKLGRDAPEISDAAAQRLESASWPGNVRELRNLIERAVVLCRGPELLPEQLVGIPTASAATPEVPARVADAPPSPPFEMPPELPASELLAGGALRSRGALQEAVKELERRQIVEALGASGGNQSQAAKALGISRATLLARIDAFGLARPRKRPRSAS